MGEVSNFHAWNYFIKSDQTLSQAAKTGGGVSILGMVLDMVLGNWVRVALLDQELDLMTSRILLS